MKKFVSVIMCVVMIFSFTAVAFAAEDVCPVIVVSGMGMELYTDDGSGVLDDTNRVWPPQAGDIVKAVVEVIPGFVQGVAKDDYSVLGNSLDGVKALFDDFSFNTEGELRTPVVAELYPENIGEYPGEGFDDAEKAEKAICRSVADKIGTENTFFFSYVWSVSPMKHADDLDEYIQHVKAVTKKDKVSLIACSMGGTITLSYLYKYGSDDIKNVVFASTAFQGTEIVGQLFTKDVSINIDDAIDYFGEFIGYDVAQSVFTLVHKILLEDEDNIISKGNEFFDKFIEDAKDAVFSDVFLDTYVTMPGIWALMPSKYYEKAKATLFTDREPYAFLEEIDEYMTEVQPKAAEIIGEARENGANVYVTATYLCPSIPLTKVDDFYTDNLIDLMYASGNATVARYGKTLSDEEITDEKFVSPDGIIDASTCILPEQTWFIKGVGHMNYEYGTGLCGLLTYLSTSNEEVSIYTNEAYPQYTEFNSITGELSKTESRKHSAVSDDYFNIILDIIKNAVKLIASFLRNLF